MSSVLTRAIIKTLFYADIFNFPLTLPEIKKYLIDFKLQDHDLSKIIKKIPFISENRGFYFFSGRKNIINLRFKKEKISLKKLIFARKIARILFFIPTIKLIAITGNLAMLSASDNDDIDLLIMTENKRIWLTRLLCVLILKAIGVYRQPQESQVADKICLNMFLDSDHLTLPTIERDLYCAHEIVQMKPLLFRHGYENILLKKNPWVKKYLPNAYEAEYRKGRSLTNLSRCDLGIDSNFFDFLELLAKKFQLFYMSRRRTTEVIRDGYLRFHPRDARSPILSAYNKNLKKYL